MRGLASVIEIVLFKRPFSLQIQDSASVVDRAPHPQPLSPEYRGEGRYLLAGWDFDRYREIIFCMRFVILSTFVIRH